MMPGMVLNTCNPSIWEAEAGGLGFVFVFVLLCFLAGTGVLPLGFKLTLYCLSYTSSPLCSVYFGDGGLSDYLLY
jgi:hypothetical protein